MDCELRHRWARLGMIAGLLGAVGLSLPPSLTRQAWAQGAEKKEEAKIVEPESVELITKDDVRIQATYYAGKKGKATVPVIILHDSKTDRNAYHALALSLQAAGHAVIVPDLRGYGESTKIRRSLGQPDVTFDAKKLGTVGYGRMVTQDMEKVKSFLREKNDEGQLNLNQLCVIGVGDLGGAVAVNWTMNDWSYQDLNTIKQSKDVHALILVSPETSFKNLQIPKFMPLLAQIQGPNKKSSEKMSFFFIAGAGKPGDATKPKEWRTVSTFNDTVARLHPQPEKEDVIADQTLFFGSMPTTLQASDLVGPQLLKSPVEIDGIKAGTTLDTMILEFIDWRLAKKVEEFPWSSRKVPGG